MLGIIFALLSAASFAFNYVFIQKGMKQSAHDNGVLMNISINVLLLGLIYGLTLLFQAHPPSWNQVGITAFLTAGLFTALFGRYSLFAGIRRIGSSRSVAIKNSAPLFAILAAILLLGETISLLAGAGLVLIMSGLGLIGYEQWKQNHSAAKKDKPWQGFILAGLAAFFFGTGQAVRKLGMEEIADPVLGAWIGAIAALLGYILILACKKELKTAFSHQIKKVNMFYVWAGVCTTSALLLFFVALSFTQVSYVSAIAATEPLFTILFAFLFLKHQEHIRPVTVISSLLVFAGILFMSYASLA